MFSIKNRAKLLNKRLNYNIKRPEMRVLPGQISFFFLMTLIPLIAIFGGFISLFDLPYSSISNMLNEYFPKGTVGLLEMISTKVDFNFNLFIFFTTSIILASNGPHSMIVASNKIYKIKDKPYLNRRWKAFLMTLVVLLLLMFILFIPVFGNAIFKIIAHVGGGSNLRIFILYLYKILKYPLSFIFIYFFIKLLYIMAPDKKIDKDSAVYGSLFTTVMWIIVTRVYSWYVERFCNYTTFYGSIASILILMTWLYLICYIFVLGMALNVTKYEQLNINDESNDVDFSDESGLKKDNLNKK